MNESVIRLGAQSFDFAPSLDLVEKLEAQFGPLAAMLEKLQKNEMTLADQKEFLAMVFDIDSRTIDNSLKSGGISGVTRACIEILAVCLMGVYALESFFKDAPHLGKS